jgi:hypothetical protein
MGKPKSARLASTRVLSSSVFSFTRGEVRKAARDSEKFARAAFFRGSQWGEQSFEEWLVGGSLLIVERDGLQPVGKKSHFHYPPID